MQEITGETSITIDAPAQVIYDYLADLGRHSEWVENVSKVTQVSVGAVGVGTIYHTQESAPPVGPLTKVRMMFHFIMGLLAGTKPYSEAEITALEPGKRVAWRAGLRKGAGWFNRAEWELRLEPQGSATRVTQHFRYMPQTATAARMIGAAGASGIATACAVSLQRLKTIVEARAFSPKASALPPTSTTSSKTSSATSSTTANSLANTSAK